MFYFVHCVSKLCRTVICNKPCHMTCSVTTVNKHGRQTYVIVSLNLISKIFKNSLNEESLQDDMEGQEQQ